MIKRQVIHHKPTRITGIVALDLDNGIGKDESMPWHIPEDFKHFKEYTQGKVCVMGRKTFEDIVSYKKTLTGDVLKDRYCVVLTSTPEEYESLGLTRVYYYSPDKIEHLKFFVGLGFWGSDVCVVGGATLFELFAGSYDEISATVLWKRFGCDTFIDFEDMIEGMELTETTSLNAKTDFPVTVSTFKKTVNE